MLVVNQKLLLLPLLQRRPMLKVQRPLRPPRLLLLLQSPPRLRILLLQKEMKAVVLGRHFRTAI